MTSNPHRRLSAIMFADIAGYTAMMQRNEQEGLAKVRRFHEVIQEEVSVHQGEVLQFLGDGCLCVFQSAVQAMHAAKSIQKSLKIQPEVPLRIGIHIGDIVMQEGNVYGDGVNLASRVESMGVPGSILFTERVIHDIKSHPEFESTSLGKFQFKNVGQPMEVFALANEGLIIPRKEEMKGKGQWIAPNPSPRNNRFLTRAFLIGVAGMIVGIGIWFGLGSNRDEALVEVTKAPSLHSIAVGNFQNLSPDEGGENAFFCEGITEDIRTHLTKLEALRVVSIDLGKEPNQQLEKASSQSIEYLLVGNVRRLADNIRVTAKLIQAENQEQIWAEHYDRELVGVFDIQSDIASSVAQALKIELTVQEKNALSPLGTDNLDAYKLYLTTTAQSLNNKEVGKRKMESIKKVIELDPNFAAAHAYLGELYSYSASWFLDHELSNEDAYQLAQEEFEIALRLNPYLEEAYLGMVPIHLHINWDFEAAEKNVQQALDMFPNSRRALAYLGWVYLIQGKFPEATIYWEKAVHIHSEYSWALAHLGFSQFLSGNHAEAETTLEKLTQTQPGYVSGIWRLAQVYMANGKSNQAAEVILTGMNNIQQRPTPLLASLGAAYAQSGNWDQASGLIHEFQQRQKSGETGLSFFIAMVYAADQDENQTLFWLEKSFQDREWEIVWMTSYPVFDFLTDHPRFREIAESIGLKGSRMAGGI